MIVSVLFDNLFRLLLMQREIGTLVIMKTNRYFTLAPSRIISFQDLPVTAARQCFHFSLAICDLRLGHWPNYTLRHLTVSAWNVRTGFSILLVHVFMNKKTECLHLGEGCVEWLVHQQGVRNFWAGRPLYQRNRLKVKVKQVKVFSHRFIDADFRHTERLDGW